MRKRRREGSESDPQPEQPPAMRFPRPKILLVDLPEEVGETLRAEGYAAADGTFGTPYKVPAGSERSKVVTHFVLPDFSEREIIVIDLTAPDVVDSPLGEDTSSPTRLAYWAKTESGSIDPRPAIMNAV